MESFEPTHPDQEKDSEPVEGPGSRVGSVLVVVVLAVILLLIVGGALMMLLAEAGR